MANNYQGGRKAGAFLYAAGLLLGIAGSLLGAFTLLQPFGIFYGVSLIFGSVVGGVILAFLAAAGTAIFDIAENTKIDR